MARALSLHVLTVALVAAFLSQCAVAQSQCPDGSYNPTKKPDGPTTCVPCPENTYADYNVRECIACPGNSTGPLRRWDLHSCYCPAGTWFDARKKPNRCSPCTPGSYCPGGPQYSTPCPSGTFNNKPGAANISACIQCPAGSYSNDVNGPTRCTQCPADSLGPNARQSGCLCSAGFYWDFFRGECAPCPNNYYCPLRDGPLPCPAGSENQRLGAITAAACIKCNATSYVTPFSSSGCMQCPAGPPKLTPNSNQTQCNCPAGTIWQAFTQKCVPCQPGNYCPGGDQTSQPCPMGTYNNITSAKNVSACTQCPKNTYSYWETGIAPYGATECYPCPKNATSKPGSSMCSCPAGSFWDMSQCVACPIGTAGSKAGSVKCDCPNGTFWHNGGGHVAQCYNCPAGTKGPNKNADACICPAGL